MSNKLKKIVASVMTVASLVVCTAGMSVSAANGKLTVDSSSATPVSYTHLTLPTILRV